MGWLIAGVLLAVLAFLPLGVRLIYSEADTGISLLIGPLAVALKQSKKKKRKKDKAPVKKAAPQEKKGASLEEFLPLARIAWDFLGELRLRMRVRILQLHLVLGGGDPADLGISYGKACGALAAFEPQLERFVKIKKKDLQIGCDFAAERSTVYARAEVTLTLGRLLFLLGRYGLRVLRAMNKNQNQRKGGRSK